jgi:hypothetical protein
MISKSIRITALVATSAMLISPGCGYISPDDEGDGRSGNTAATSTDTNNNDGGSPFGGGAEQDPTVDSAIEGEGGLASFNFQRNAVRRYEELKTSIAAVTCVSDADTPSSGAKTYAQFYADVSGNLPTTNDPKQYIASNIVGTMNLASYACLISVRRDTAKACQWSAGLRGATDPDSAFTDSSITELGRSLAAHFWGWEGSVIAEDSQYIDDLKETVTQLQTEIESHLDAEGANAANRGGLVVEGVLVSLCSAALASSHFTTF